MIRSSRHTIRFANKNKQEEVLLFIEQYKLMVKKYVNILWNEYKHNIPSLLNNDVCKSIKTDVSNDSRIRQCAGKQACSMIKSIFEKQNKRLYKLKQLQKENKDTTYLQRKISQFIETKPNINNINVELDSRFINFEEGNHFDLFVEVEQIGNKRKIRLPIKYTRVSNKWLKLGKMKSSIRLNKKDITLYYEIEQPKKQGSKVVGADQGITTCLSFSDKQTTKKNKDNYDLSNIMDILSKRKKGSKGFRRGQEHRKNYINWSINQLDFGDVKQVNLEKIMNIRKDKVSSRKQSHWTYTMIKNKLISLAEDKGFIFVEQDNKFMSQRCSACGWTHKSNRLAKTFICKNTGCNLVIDSDINAACNHEVELIKLPEMVWYKHINRTIGFFWLKDKIVYGQESIVPDVKENTFQ